MEKVLINLDGAVSGPAQMWVEGNRNKGSSMNQYEAKFAREAKDYPTCWIIVPNGLGSYCLARIAQDPKPKLKLRIVK